MLEKTNNWDDMTDRMIGTGDIVAGDVIRWTEAVWGAYSHRRHNKPLGERINVGRVIKESYGAKTQQHSFSIRIDISTGCDSYAKGTKIRRMGRNLYRYDPDRLLWVDESARNKIAAEKHLRGEHAREARDERELDKVRDTIGFRRMAAAQRDVDIHAERFDG